jgi:DUF4097 and DUF4098 domain-containing protein YvlB
MRRRSIAGPIVMILIGVFFLLGTMHVLNGHALALLFAHYWPFLLILWGIIKLLEYFAAQHSGYEARGIGVGGVLFLVFLIIVGVSATTASRVNWSELNVNGSNDDWTWLFGNTYQYSDTLEQSFPTNGSLRVQASHGDVTITSWDQNQIKVLVTKKVVSDDRGKAEQINSQTKPTLSVEGNVVTLDSGNRNGDYHNSLLDGGSAVHTDLEIFLPTKGAISITDDHGDLKITQRTGDVEIANSHGDVTIQDITGNASVNQSHGDFVARNVTGDLTLEGRVDDVQIQGVTGTATLNGDFFSDISLSQIGKLVRFDSSRTNLQAGALPGDLTMDGSDLHVSNVSGGFTVRTNNKDVNLENPGGDVSIENSNGDVEVHAGAQPLGNLNVSNRNSSIEVYLPSNEAFLVQATTREGDIGSDFDLQQNNNSGVANASGATGAGAKHTITLNNEHADIEIRKSGNDAMSPPTPPTPPSPPRQHGAKPASSTRTAQLGKAIL